MKDADFRTPREAFGAALKLAVALAGREQVGQRGVESMCSVPSSSLAVLIWGSEGSSAVGWRFPAPGAGQHGASPLQRIGRGGLAGGELVGELGYVCLLFGVLDGHAHQGAPICLKSEMREAILEGGRPIAAVAFSPDTANLLDPGNS